MREIGIGLAIAGCAWAFAWGSVNLSRMNHLCLEPYVWVLQEDCPPGAKCLVKRVPVREYNSGKWVFTTTTTAPGSKPLIGWKITEGSKEIK